MSASAHRPPGASAPSPAAEALLERPIKAWMTTCWYPAYLDGLPDLLVARLPDALTAGDPQLTWRLWVVEDAADRAFLTGCLEQRARVRPTADGHLVEIPLDRSVTRAAKRPPGGPPLIGLYPPPDGAPGFPWVVLTVAPTAGSTADFIRGRYAYDTFATLAAAQEHLVRLAAEMRRGSPGLTIEVQAPPSPGGGALR